MPLDKSRFAAWADILAHPARHFQPHRAVVRAAQAFVSIEASSGIVLLLAAIVALIWANSSWSGSYFDLLNSHMSLGLGLVSLDESLQHVVNDGLMTIFFFMVGLEIKREVVHGELSDVRRAMLPAAAALGGMIVPATLYIALNAGGDGVDGWGVPMATDIAFALGVLSLLGRRVPFGIKVFLLALAIADDIGAILVIALFYTSSIDMEALAVAAGLFVVIVAMNRAGVRNVDVYVLVGIALWLAAFESGIHPTLAGVALGLLTPATPYFARESFAASADELVVRYRQAFAEDARDEQQDVLGQLEDLSHGTEAPVDRLERRLHPWVSYLIVPLFALANAGVAVSGDVAEQAVGSSVSLGIVLGLVVGKPVGIFLFTWLAVRMGMGTLPNGAGWSHIFGVGLLGGIGFTVSLLIAGLAFDDALLTDEAKLGVLAASAISGSLGFAFLWLLAKRSPATASVSLEE